MAEKNIYLKIPKRDSYVDVIPKLVRTVNNVAHNSIDFELKCPKNNGLFVDHQDYVHFKMGKDYYKYKLSPLAKQQLCTKAGLPVSFVNKISCSRYEDIRSMSCDFLNKLLSYYDRSLLLRTYGNEVRGIVSNRYKVFDTHSIMEVLTDCLEKTSFIDYKDLVVRGYHATPEMFHLRFTERQPLKLKRDKDLFCGMSITSSDVGVSSLKVHFFIYKQICTNGLCIQSFDKDLFCVRHIGVDKEEFRKGIKHSLSLFSSISYNATKVLNAASEKSLLGTEALSAKANNESIRTWLKSYLDVSENDLRVIREIALEQYGSSLWDYCNAITDFAQRYTFSKREALELKAGELMTTYSDYLVA